MRETVRRMERNRMIGLVLGLMALLHGGSAVAQPKAGGPLVFDVPATAYSANTGYLPFAVAEVKGLFEQAGVKPNLINSGGGGIALRAFTSSDAPLGVEGVPSALPAIEAGVEFKIVGQTSRRSDTWVVVKTSSPITALADLRGKKVGVSGPKSTLEAIAKAMLGKAGLTEKDAKLEYLGAVPNILIALDRGLIDVATGAGQVSLYHHTEVLKDWRLLGRGDDFLPVIDAVIVAKNATIRDNPELVRRFLDAVRNGTRYLAAKPNTDEVMNVVAKWQKISDPKLEPAVRAMVENLIGSGRAEEFWGDLRVDMGKMESIARDLVAQGALKRFPANWGAFVDHRFTQ